jgi:hypothetical protein
VNHFWDISLANIVTWIVLIVGFAGSQYVVVKLQGERLNGHDKLMNEFKEWIKIHQKDSNERDQILTRLTTIQEASERRLEKLEGNDRRAYIRSENPLPYYGPKRRKDD